VVHEAPQAQLPVAAQQDAQDVLGVKVGQQLILKQGGVQKITNPANIHRYAIIHLGQPISIQPILTPLPLAQILPQVLELVDQRTQRVVVEPVVVVICQLGGVEVGRQVALVELL
jgi:hypothetical protein